MRLLICLFISLFMIGCGGSGGSNDSTNPSTPSTPSNADAKGIYKGQSSNGIEFTILVTENKIYAVTIDPLQPLIPADIGIGDYTVNGNNLTANDLVYFNYSEGFGTIDLSATVSPNSSLNGSVTIGNVQTTFTSNFDSSYNNTASIDEIAGRSTGLSASQISGYESALLNINNQGIVSGTSYSGCSASGNISPSTEGNYYNNQLTVTNCGALSGENLTGVSLYDEDSNILYTIAINDSQSSGFIYWGDVVRAINTDSIVNVPRGDSESQSNGEGLWYGTTADNRTLMSLITDEGESYVLYSGTNSNNLAGVVYGYVINTEAGFESIIARDFNLEGFGILDLDVSAVTTADSSGISGTLNYDGSVNNFELNYDNTYELSATTQQLIGTYIGNSFISVGSESATVTIDSNGRFTGEGTSGCQVQGVLEPRSRGNFFDMSITFRNNSCLYPNQLFSGVLVFNASTNTIYAAAPNPNLTDGLLYIGTKQ